MKICFIENDIHFDEDVEGFFIGNWFDDMGLHTNGSILQHFDIVVLDAYRNHEDVISAINECDVIFIYTSFIGTSKRLFYDMADYVLNETDIKDKFIVNFVTNEYAIGIDGDLVKKIHELKQKRDIIYMDRDDIRIEALLDHIIKAKDIQP